ncbi:MAG: hypothetical protein A3J75_04130 [Acidobacteria bacterium RBG_16_68_9]|nr:MAG: hypothetical protein A3J75_04130 [Acidobacteria bacterium RBG_16_68_9]
METKPESEVERLAALQEIDRRLKERREQLAEITGEIDDLDARVTQCTKEIATLGAERNALEARRVDMEARSDVESARIRDNRMRMNRVRNERELLALRREVDLAKEANKQIEEQLIAVMEEIEELDRRRAATAEALAALRAEAEHVEAERKERTDRLRAEIETLAPERDAIAQGLTGSLRAKYEQIFARRGGTAVVEVRNGTCKGCHMNVPPQLFNELKKFRDVRSCPNCHRILYYRPELPDASAPHGG